MSFALHVLCDGMISFTGRGDLHATWTIQWLASGAVGPSSFDGVIEGGTASYRNAAGDFHAIALPNRDVQLSADITG
jgi:hypothetical protein